MPIVDHHHHRRRRRPLSKDHRGHLDRAGLLVVRPSPGLGFGERRQDLVRSSDDLVVFHLLDEIVLRPSSWKRKGQSEEERNGGDADLHDDRRKGSGSFSLLEVRWDGKKDRRSSIEKRSEN